MNDETLIEQANKAAERLEKANREFDANMARAALGGKSDAGAPSEKKEETPIEYKNRVLGGLIK